MRIKLIMIILAIVGILILAGFSFNLKEIALEQMVKEIPEYNCEGDGICTSCLIEGNMCSCGPATCDCGNKTVDKEACNFYDLNKRQ